MKLPYERSTAFDDFGNFVWDVLLDEATHTTDYSDCVFVCVCIARTHTHIVVQNMFVVIHAELSIRGRILHTRLPKPFFMWFRLHFAIDQ